MASKAKTIVLDAEGIDLAEGVREALNQLNMLIQFLMEQLCRLLPMLIVVMSISQTWAGTLGVLLQSWLHSLGVLDRSSNEDGDE